VASPQAEITTQHDGGRIQIWYQVLYRLEQCRLRYTAEVEI